MMRRTLCLLDTANGGRFTELASTYDRDISHLKRQGMRVSPRKGEIVFIRSDPTRAIVWRRPRQ